MTTVICRVYVHPSDAVTVVENLAAAGFPASTYDVIGAGEDAAAAMATARVPRIDIATYDEVLQHQTKMVVVRAPVTPFGAARKAIEIVDAVPSVSVPVAEKDVHIRETANRDLYIGLSILRDHPRWFSGDIRPGRDRPRARMSEVFYWPLLSKRKPRKSAIPGGGYLSTKLLPFPLLATHKRSTSAIHGGRRWLYNPGS
ncbi:MAG: hypothetical protein AAGP08_11325 [Pseudomonadota bacterium]